MKEATLSPIGFPQAKPLVDEVCVDACEYHPIPLSNSQKVRDFLNSNHEAGAAGFIIVSYKKGDTIVTRGLITGKYAICLARVVFSQERSKEAF